MMKSTMMNFTLNKRKSHKSHAGLAAIEFVLVLPILLTIAYITIDFGRLLFQYDTLTKSTRDATRYLASVTRPPAAAYASDANYSAAVTATQNLALCGNVTACGGNALVSGLNASHILIDYPAKEGTIGFVRVRITGYSTSFLTTVFPGVTSKDLGTVSVTMRQIQQ